MAQQSGVEHEIRASLRGRCVWVQEKASLVSKEDCSRWRDLGLLAQEELERPTDITENVIREAALPIGLVDIKVCAVDEVWSGLKLMIRKEQR